MKTVWCLTPKRFFNKGDSFLSIAETTKSVYTEYFTAPGKFTWDGSGNQI